MPSEISISDLNNNCLLRVFEFVSLSERLSIELVCRQWYEICSSLWKATFSLDAMDKGVGYEFKPLKRYGDTPAGDINVSICRQVLSKSFNHLTRINLSRIDTLENISLMSCCKHCTLGLGRKRQGTLNECKALLLKCENIEELAFCSCVVYANDKYLGQLFQNNKKLRSLTLCGYEFIGMCITYLPLDMVESIHLHDCVVDVRFINLVISKARKLHTLTTRMCFDSQVRFIRLKFLPRLPLNMLRLNIENQRCEDHISEIVELENLTILSLQGTFLENHHIKKIVRNCTKLVALTISGNVNLTDDCFHSVNALSGLKCLNISANHKLTDAGLELLNVNLQALDVSVCEFSANALILAIEKMQQLELLRVCLCKQLKTCFIGDVIDVVEQRPDKIPLTVVALGSCINIEELGDAGPSVTVTSQLLPNYKRYY